jgi:NADH-quinone oxidoreductase subunit H
MDIINNLVKIIGDAIANAITGALGQGLLSEFLIMALAALIVFAVASGGFAGLTYAERKIVARIQDRVGPNQAGPYGILQPIADAVKLFTKEDTTPTHADFWVYNLAPIIVAVFATLTFAVVPFAPGVVGTNLNIGAFYIIAIGSASTIAILMAGWGSNNKYSLLGAFRTVAQLVGYEVPMLLNIVPVIMLTGSMSLVDIIERQAGVTGGAGLPFILILPLSALSFLISGIAETGRSPFDLLEAESEIVAGFHVEYSGMKFGLIMMGEYMNALGVAVMFAVLFLGGYTGPILPPYIWLVVKAVGVFLVLMWLRGTLPRVRIDQLLAMNWKFFVPLSVINIIIVMILGKLFVSDQALWKANGGLLVHPLVQALIMGGASLGLLLLALAIVANRVRRERFAEERMLVERRESNQQFATATH